MRNLTESEWLRLWPEADPAFVRGLVAAQAAVFPATGINTNLRHVHFLAQISHESGGGRIIRENMNYSADRLFEIFGEGHHSAKVSREEAQSLARRPQEIAERVYGLGNPKKSRELGNNQPGDGYRFRGQGLLQLTGRANFARIGKMIGVDLVNHPELATTPATALRIAATEFMILGCLPWADKDDLRQVTIKVNGGLNGLDDRAAWLKKCKRLLGMG